MPIPATSGQFRTRLEDMQIGDYIAYRCTSTSNGIPCSIYDIGASLEVAKANEIPVTGSLTPIGYAYAIKVDTGLCISDRVVQNGISWDALNNANLIQGKLQLSYPYSPYPFLSSYPITNLCDKNIASAAYFQDIGSANENSYTAEQRSITFYLGKQLNSFNVTIKVGYGMDTFEILTSLDGSNWTSVGKKDIAFNSEQAYQISAPSKYIKIYDMKTSFISGASLGLTEVSVEGVQSLIFYNRAIRSIKGGNAYLGADSKFSLTDKNLGAWPINNEWDKYIVGSNLGGKITAGDDNVWHWNTGHSSWCQGTPVSNVTGSNLAVGVSSNRQHRGRYVYGSTAYGTILGLSNSGSSLGDPGIGFRPVFQFLELNSKASNLFY